MSVLSPNFSCGKSGISFIMRVHVKSSLSIQEQKTEVLMPFVCMLHAVFRWDIKAALYNKSIKKRKIQKYNYCSPFVLQIPTKI